MKKTIVTAVSALGLILSAQALAGPPAADDNIAILPIASNVAQDDSTANSQSHNALLSGNSLLSGNTANTTTNTSVKVKAQVASTNLNGAVIGGVAAGDGGDGAEGIDDALLAGVGVGALGLGVGVGGVGVGVGAGGDAGSAVSNTTNTLANNALAGSSGIYQVAQTGGMNTMAQQGVTVQSNMSFSK